VLGELFPPSIIGSATVLGAASAGVGKDRVLHHRSELEAGLSDSRWSRHAASAEVRR
jgi:hypothetical protein